MSKKSLSDLSQPIVLTVVDNLLTASGGNWSPRPKTGDLRRPGVDVFVPFTQARMPFLLNKAKALGNGMNAIASLSVFGSDGQGNINRIGVETLTPVPQAAGSNNWWSIGLLYFDTPEQAKTAAKIGLEENLPTAYGPDLGLSDETAASALAAIAAQIRPVRGLAAFSQPKPLLPSLENCVVLCSPSGSEGDEESYWGNPSRISTQRNTIVASASIAGTGNGGEIEMV